MTPVIHSIAPHINNFVRMMQYCVASYKKRLLRKDAIFDDAVDVRFFTNDYDSGFICQLEDKFVLCFEGTDGLKAWKENLDTFPIKLHGGRHNGFYEGYERFENIICRFILSRGLSLPIYITGHSRGAAIASNAAYELSQKIPGPIMLYAFASPNFCTVRFTTLFYASKKITAYRILNGADPIEGVPPTELGFVAIGEHYHIGTGKTIFGRFVNWLQSKTPFARYIDHSPKLYLKNLIRIQKKFLK